MISISVWVRLVGLIAFVVGLFGSFGYVHHKGFEAGKNKVQAEWELEKKKNHDDYVAALIERNKEISRLTVVYATAESKANELNGKIQLQSDVFKRDLIATRAAGGLRLPGSVCADFARETKAYGASDVDGAFSVRLPDRVEDGLYEIAEKGAECKIRLENLQIWIKDVGLYP
ncbi:hypothetical protein ACO0K3_03690 [Undibacterium sp. Rencai35W]|uniref:hypothetical protein n=1 Tax=Undibacterium sp. Rencai35W TaxID=3413046 RepID=UPI003BF2BB31